MPPGVASLPLVFRLPCFQLSVPPVLSRSARRPMTMRREPSPTPTVSKTVPALLQRIRAVSAAALRTGALQPIETASTLLSDGNGPPFLVRVVRNLSRKDGAGGARRDPTKAQASGSRGGAAAAFNPFLPYDRALYVEHVAPRHVLLLNKFNVVDDHVLLVTEAFEEQGSGMSEGDVQAMVGCLRQVDGVGFYNSGGVAGASQRHKHVQIVCGSVGEMGALEGVCPFDARFSAAARAVAAGETFECEELGFAHAGVGTEGAGVKEWWERYGKALKRVRELCGEGVEFNVVATRRWMVVVGRSEECFDGVSVNALGFVGCLLVRTDEMLDKVREVGGLRILQSTAFGEARG